MVFTDPVNREKQCRLLECVDTQPDLRICCSHMAGTAFLRIITKSIRTVGFFGNSSLDMILSDDYKCSKDISPY